MDNINIFNDDSYRGLVDLIDKINEKPHEILKEINVNEFHDVNNSEGMLDYHDIEVIFGLIEHSKKNERKADRTLSQLKSLSQLEQAFIYHTSKLIEDKLIYAPERMKSDFEFLEFYNDLINKELKIDTNQLEELYFDRYGQQLYRLFVNHFNDENLLYFILHVYSFIIETSPFLLFGSGKSNGNYYGEILTINLSDYFPTDLRRIWQFKIIDFLKNKTSYSDFYRTAYIDNYNSLISSSNPLITHFQYSNFPNKDFYNHLNTGEFVPLIGNRTSDDVLFFCINSEETQNIYPFGVYVTEDELRFIGVCANKPKRSPSKGDSFVLKTKEKAKEVFDPYSIYHFQRLLINFPNFQNNELVDITEDPDLYWNTIQHFFWLITQKHQNPKAFLHYFGPTDDSNLDLVTRYIQLLSNLSDHAEENAYSVKLASQMLHYLLKAKIPIFSENFETINSLSSLTNAPVTDMMLMELKFFLHQKTLKRKT